MPTCRRKRVVLTEPSDAISKALKTDPDKEVYFLRQTGEIFDTYEQYSARMSFYRQKQFQCEVTGKSGLDYFQAVESEQQEARILHHRFPQPLKAAVLRSVQYQVVGRLDHLVEAVFERFKDRYFKDEKILVDLGGVKYGARVEKVFTPKYNEDTAARDNYKPAMPGGKSGEFPEGEDPPHTISGDLKESAKDANARDDPSLYYYWVHVLDFERSKGEGAKAARDSDNLKMIDSIREVQCDMMSRDRLSFSKSILRRFIRDCVDRDAAVASPWIVKTPIAKHYGVYIQPTENKPKASESSKKSSETEKRKKVWEEKELPPTKRQKKMMEAQEEKERQATEKAEKQRQLKEEAVLQQSPEKKKKKPVRYPTEDLDVQLSEKDKKAGMKVMRPLPSRIAPPFHKPAGSYEAFLMTWNFLVVYGNALHLSTITLDEFEHAIQHSVKGLPCSILSEVHTSLIHVLRGVPFIKHSAAISLIAPQNLQPKLLFGVSVDTLTAEMNNHGGDWERAPLKIQEGRGGWEDAMLGCLKDHATLENFPDLRDILTKLLFAPDPQAETAVSSSSSSPESTPDPPDLTVPSDPADRYYALPVSDRIAILSFMTDLAMSSKTIHAYIEKCEEELTALRKEKIDVNRLRKQHSEDMNALKIEMKGEEASPAPNVDQEASVVDSEMSDVSGVDAGLKKGKKDAPPPPQNGSTGGKREAARAKQASIKQATAEYRRLDEEVNKLERRLEAIEREFRKLLSSIRVKPLGRDRFYNRIWWFDGMGAGSLVGSGGATQYQAGRLFIQGPSNIDNVILLNKLGQDELDKRYEEELGTEGTLLENQWATYSDIEEASLILEEFLAWLNPKGQREVALKGVLTKWWPHITSGARRRVADLSASARIPEARRSTRTKSAAGYDLSREPYMVWSNRKATTTAMA
ncbi:hypothetical protein MIND_00458400 [Mycena indigotica]|uniref:Chromatin remodeling complex protein n=1 Tax=Mycena indigotica TaxID=2126181 RepID=A0A8H6SWP5_9AGAR|nr:uncharacterized protein MIND_00458400 [Mycena indigotica]KAF7306668.1 hypothetical protein MIND_00458400 [Mycena indigotica]